MEQIPAEDIERVEVITNPSVAFDANTTGGIINIVQKKNTRPGYFGQVQGGLGTNDRVQGGANLNMKEGRWAFSLGANYNTGENTTDGNSDRVERNNGTTTGFFDQDTDSRSRRTMNGGRLGIDWQVSNRNLITFSHQILIVVVVIVYYGLWTQSNPLLSLAGLVLVLVLVGIEERQQPLGQTGEVPLGDLQRRLGHLPVPAISPGPPGAVPSG